MRLLSPCRYLLALLCFVLSCNFLFAQYNYVGSLDHTNGAIVHDVDHQSGGTMVLLMQNGTANSLLAAVDSVGSLIWAKSIAGNYEDLMVASDGSIFIMAPNQGNVLLAKLTPTGDSLWHRFYPLAVSATEDFFADLAPDGDVILGGFYSDFFIGQESKIAKIDAATGNPIWMRRRAANRLSGITATRDGGCILLFKPLAFGIVPGGEINRLDSMGNFLWGKELLGGSGLIRRTTETTQGDIIIQVDTIGLSSNGQSPVFLSRLDSAGNFLFGIEVVENFSGNSFVSGFGFNDLRPSLDNGAIAGGLRAFGDIQVQYFPVSLYLGTDLNSTFMTHRYDPDIPFETNPIYSYVTALDDPIESGFGIATNTSEFYTPNSKVYLLKKRTVPVTSCEDSIKTFRIYIGDSLAPVAPQFSPLTLTSTPIPLPIMTSTASITNLCLECIKPLSGGFFSQGGVGSASFTSTMVNADSLVWDFGDGNTSNDSTPTHSYSTPGIYTVCLTGYGLCDTLDTCQTVSILVGTEAGFATRLQVYPVPADQKLMVKGNMPLGTRLRLLDLRGKVMFQQELLNESQQESINVAALPSGIYWLEISHDDQRFVKQVEVLR